MKQFSLFARRALLLSMLGFAAPAALVAGGCGGGASGGSPISSNYKLAATLDYSAVSSGSNAFTTRIETLETDGSFSGTLLTRNGQQNAAFNGVNRIVNNAIERRFYVQLASPSGRLFAVGQEIPLALGTQSTILLRQSNTGNTPGERIWNCDGGTATVTAIGPDSIDLRLNNVRFVPSSAFLGSGTFLLNGTLSAAGLNVGTN